MSNSILKNLSKIALNFELSRRHPRRGRQPYHVSYDAPLENPSHIIFGCAFAHGFRTLSTPAMVSSPRSPTWSPCALPPSATLNTALTLRLPFLSHLWKHGNNIMFNELAPFLSLLRTDDVVLWRARLPMDHLDVNLWLTYLVPEQL
jgi:hypothetical protein